MLAVAVASCEVRLVPGFERDAVNATDLEPGLGFRRGQLLHVTCDVDLGQLPDYCMRDCVGGYSRVA